MHSITNQGRKFVAIGGYYPATQIYESEDGINWDTFNMISNNDYHYSVILNWLNDKFIKVRPHGEIYTSADALDWKLANMNSDNPFPVDGNADKDKTVLTFIANNIVQEGIGNNMMTNADTYVSAGFLVKVRDSYAFFDTLSGMYLFNPMAKTFIKFTDIVSNSVYYANDRLYLIKDSEIGFIDLANRNYSKLFSKKGILPSNHDTIDDVDVAGNVLFTARQPIGMEHCNQYQYKYIVKENKLSLVKITAGRYGETINEKIGEVIDVDN